MKSKTVIIKNDHTPLSISLLEFMKKRKKAATENPKDEPTEHQVNDEYRKKGVGVWA